MYRKIITLLMLTGPVLAAGPNEVSYQGYLQNTDGSGVSGTVDLQIAVWNDAVSTDAADLLYLEDHLAVPVANGLFSIPLGGGGVLLGSFDADLFADSDRWLETRVDGEPLTPRTKFLTVPYALQAREAETLSGMSGAVMHFALPACPPGWSELIDARGRVIVGLQAGGTLAATSGSPLGNLEARQHAHLLSTPSVTSQLAGSHTHTASSRTTSSDTHNHRWSQWNGAANDWLSFNSSGSVITVTNWTNGMDAAGSGIYPLAASSTATTNIYTDNDAHSHTAVSHNTDTNGSHSHVNNGVTFNTFNAVSDPALPYLQLLACIKD